LACLDSQAEWSDVAALDIKGKLYQNIFL
jgi:hypothetical protein